MNNYEAIASTGQEWLLTGRDVLVPAARVERALVVAMTILAIGVADYLTGIHVSLSVFYFVPLLLTVSWFGGQVAAVVALVCVAIRIIGMQLATDQLPLPGWIWWNALHTLVVLLIVVWLFDRLLVLARDLESRVRIRTAALQEAADQRRQLEHELLLSGSRERNRIGQDLHDDICQHLVGTALVAKGLAQRLEARDKSLGADAHGVVRLIEEGASKVRQVAHGLLLEAIEPSHLAGKLTELVRASSRPRRQCRFHCRGTVTLGDASTAAQLYRVAQEALQNALRHSGARHIDLSLIGNETTICLTIEDDGQGFADAGRDSGMGLRIMSQRAAYIGAKLVITSIPGAGTKVICHMPRPN